MDKETAKLYSQAAACPKCGSDMAEAEIRSTCGFSLVAKDGRQRLWDSSGLEANVCTQCGYTEFYAKRPDKF